MKIFEIIKDYFQPLKRCRMYAKRLNKINYEIDSFLKENKNLSTEVSNFIELIDMYLDEK